MVTPYISSADPNVCLPYCKTISFTLGMKSAIRIFSIILKEIMPSPYGIETNFSPLYCSLRLKFDMI